MQLNNYFNESNNQISFTRQQASHFAKVVAGDYNPIHDEDSKRFCVPGDLLFAVLLSKAGISENMRVEFAGMINDGVALHLDTDEDDNLQIVDQQGKLYLSMHRSGANRVDEKLAANVAENYVRFSGMNFPHIMVPLMKDSGMMINPDRPLVIYESMELNFDHLNFTAPTVSLTESKMDVEGKRGSVTLSFCFEENGEVIGHGRKRMLCSGLRPYDEDAVADLVNRFNSRKEDFLTAQPA